MAQKEMSYLVTQAENLLLVRLVRVEVDELSFFVAEGDSRGDREVFNHGDLGLIRQLLQGVDS